MSKARLTVYLFAGFVLLVLIIAIAVMLHGSSLSSLHG